MKTLGETLKDGRELIGMTLRQVEDVISVSNSYLSQLENDKIKKPSANVLYKLSTLYCIELDRLLYAAGIIIVEPLNSGNKILNTIRIQSGPLLSEEEQALLDYLKYLRFRKR